MDSENVFMFIMGLMIGFFFTCMFASINGIDISQETGDDICRQLTGNESAIAEDRALIEIDGGKLICVTPSYDSTQNIIIERNNE